MHAPSSHVNATVSPDRLSVSSDCKLDPTTIPDGDFLATDLLRVSNLPSDFPVLRLLFLSFFFFFSLRVTRVAHLEMSGTNGSMVRIVQGINRAVYAYNSRSWNLVNYSVKFFSVRHVRSFTNDESPRRLIRLDGTFQHSRNERNEYIVGISICRFQD